MFIRKNQGNGGWAKGKELRNKSKFSLAGLAFATQKNTKRQNEKDLTPSYDQSMIDAGLVHNSEGEWIVPRKDIVKKSPERLLEYLNTKSLK